MPCAVPIPPEVACCSLLFKHACTGRTRFYAVSGDCGACDLVVDDCTARAVNQEEYRQSVSITPGTSSDAEKIHCGSNTTRNTIMGFNSREALAFVVAIISALLALGSATIAFSQLLVARRHFDLEAQSRAMSIPFQGQVEDQGESGVIPAEGSIQEGKRHAYRRLRFTKASLTTIPADGLQSQQRGATVES